MFVDIPIIQITSTIDNNIDDLKQLNLQIGIISSALEHAVLEQMFVTDSINPPDAISAVKALAKASAAGQKIYQISQNNMTSVLPNIRHDQATMDEIRASLQVGKIVITHTDAVSIPSGWSGAGYIILDPDTNVGAWKIGGGLNGGGSSDIGVIDFAHAVIGQPGLIFPTCSFPFVNQVIENFANTNRAIFGLAGPPGLTLLTGGAVAETVGGFTLLRAVRLTFANPTFAVGNLLVALATSIINFLLVSLFFEIGVLIGSAISATFCRKQ